MVWLANHYSCYRCNDTWIDEWSCACDDECPSCGARNCSPFDSDDLSGFIEEDAGEYVVYISPAAAEHTPEYEEIGRYASRKIAEKVMARRISEEFDRAFG